MDRFAWVRIPCSMQSRSLKLNNKEDGALPVLVVQFPPLALLLNGILDALNDIRYSLYRALNSPGELRL